MMRNTSMRRKVLALFESSKKPLSVKSIKEKLPGSDTVTVYRTVGALLSLGKIKKVDLRGRAALYESASRHHHHIVCTSCGKIEDFEGCELGAVERQTLRASRAFAKITDHSFELFGLCTSCDS